LNFCSYAQTALASSWIQAFQQHYFAQMLLAAADDSCSLAELLEQSVYCIVEQSYATMCRRQQTVAPKCFDDLEVRLLPQ
jgi:hypothetical protein